MSLGEGRIRVAGLFAVLAVCVAGSYPAALGASTVAPRTLAVVPHGISALAQDGGRVAWVGCDGVGVLDGGGRTLIRDPMTCSGDPGSVVALSGRQVLWTAIGGGNIQEVGVKTASLDRRVTRQIDSASFYGDFTGRFFGGVAGDGSTLAYTWLEISPSVGLSCVSLGTPCRAVLAGGDTWQVVGSAKRRVRGAQAARAIAASGGLLALVPPNHDSWPTLGTCACNYQPAWSPDGTRIAFASGRADTGTAIYTMAPDGSGLAKLTGGTAFNTAPAWSPDGRKLAFERLPPFHGELNPSEPALYVMNADGTGKHELADGGSPYDVQGPSWSPDGLQLAFARATGIFLVDVSGGSERQLVGPDAFAPAWSSHDTLAFIRKNRIWSIHSDGTSERPLTGKVSPVGLAWSPDASKLAYWVSGGSIVVAGADGKNPRALGYGFWPSWSPDGTQIVFSDSRDNVPPTPDRLELYLMRADGSGRTPLTTTNPARQDAPVEIINARRGSVVTSFEPGGRVQAVTLSPQLAAVLVKTEADTHIELYDTHHGTLRHIFSIPGDSAPSISLSGRTLVFHRGNSIFALDTTTGKRSLLATAKTQPIGLSIAGSHVIWAENVGVKPGTPSGYGRIESLTAPEA